MCNYQNSIQNRATYDEQELSEEQLGTVVGGFQPIKHAKLMDETDLLWLITHYSGRPGQIDEKLPRYKVAPRTRRKKR